MKLAHAGLSYRLYYPWRMAKREKRSISLPPDLSAAIDEAAAAEGKTVSAWIADVIDHRLRIDAGLRGVAEWEAEHGAFTEEELAWADERVREMLRDDTDARMQK